MAPSGEMLSIAALLVLRRKLVISVAVFFISCCMFATNKANNKANIVIATITTAAIVLVIASLFCILVESLAIHGTKNRSPCLLMLWLVFNSFVIISQLYCTGKIGYDGFSKLNEFTGFFIFLIGGLLTGYNIYETKVVHDCYKHLHNIRIGNHGFTPAVRSQGV